ncbi:MAG: Mbeg1-like protein [Eubacteriales bacterium]
MNDDGTLSEPYANWTIEAIVNENPVGGSGLWACILDTGSDSILACRGSETSQLLEKDITQDWIGADLALLFSTETAQEADLKAFMEENAELLNSQDWYATGHSLGGALADYAAVISACENSTVNTVTGATNFDGPGHSAEFIALYITEIATVADTMTHIKASFVSCFLIELPGVTSKLIETVADYILSTTYHLTGNWETDANGNLVESTEGESVVMYLTSFLSQAVTANFSFATSEEYRDYIFTSISDWISEKADQIKDVAKEIKDKVVEEVSAAVALMASLIESAMEALKEKLDEVKDMIESYVNRVIEAIADAATEILDATEEFKAALCQALLDTLGSICAFVRSLSAGVKYAADNPYFKVDTAKLESYATRIIMVNARLTDLDTDLRGLYWQVGFTDIWDILTANLIVGGSSTLNKIKSYLNDAADDFAQAEQKASQYIGG